MTDREITMLVAVRNQITDKETDIFATYTPHSVDLIDDMLREVPQGKRLDVDKLLGRASAVVSVFEAHRNEYPNLSQDDIAQMEARCAEQDGMTEHYTSATEGHW